MKRLVSFFFLLFFGFNTLGYYLYTNLAGLHSEKKLEAILDEGNYSEEELLRIEIPLNLPYTTDWSSPERVNGSIVLKGRTYNYVKRIYTGGTMVYWCIKNTSSILITQQANDFFGKVSGMPVSKQASKIPDLKKDWSCSTNQLSWTVNFFTDLIVYARFVSHPLLTGAAIQPYRPPEVIRCSL